MPSLRVLFIRAALAIVIALIAMRLFFPGRGVAKMVALAVLLLGLAYVFEYTKRRNRDR